MKKIFLLFFLFSGIIYSQDQDTTISKIYFGFSAGLSPQTMGHTDFIFGWGAHLLYAWDNQYIRFSYSRTAAFFLTWNDNDVIDNSKIHRVEFVYGRTTKVKDNHKLLSHIYVGAMAGIDYNSIGYYTEDRNYYPHSSTTVSRFGVPIGITISNSFNSWIFYGWEMKYHILYKEVPFGEYKYFVMFKL